MEEANAAQPEGLAPMNEEALAAANGNGLPPMENGHAPVDEVLAAANGNNGQAPVLDEVLAAANGNDGQAPVLDEVLVAANGNDGQAPVLDEVLAAANGNEGHAPVQDELLAEANGNDGHAPGLDELLAEANGNDGHAPGLDEVLAEANGNGHIVLPPPVDVDGNEHAPVVMVEEIFDEDGLDPVDEAQLEVVPLVEEPDDQDGLDPVPVVAEPSEFPLPADRQMGEMRIQVLMDGDPIQHWFNLTDDVEAVVENNWYAYRLRISSIYRSMLEGETVEDTERRLAGNELLVFDNNVDNLEIAFNIKIRTRPREDFEAITEALDREIEGTFDLFGLEYQV